MREKLSDQSIKPPDKLRDPTDSFKLVPMTVLFADIAGSTRMYEKQGDVAARKIISRTLNILAARTQESNGTVIKTIGDEIMCHFPDAESGVNAACKMQQSIISDSELSKFNIAIKIGLHHGLVLIEKSDVFGDAVNVAARMVQFAKANQIITTLETAESLPIHSKTMPRRDLGRSWIKGKQDEMEIVEIIWSEETQMTHVSSDRREELHSSLFSRLILDYQNKSLKVEPSGQPFNIGRGDKNDLVVDRELVSRSHAAIVFRQGKFILEDHSTNGTYLFLDNGERFFVRREEIVLHGSGIICLGQIMPAQDSNVVRYSRIMET